MLWVTHCGLIPCRGGGGSSASLASGAHPEVNDARSLRWEQDEAYEESLAADRWVGGGDGWRRWQFPCCLEWGVGRGDRAARGCCVSGLGSGAVVGVVLRC